MIKNLLKIVLCLGTYCLVVNSHVCMSMQGTQSNRYGVANTNNLYNMQQNTFTKANRLHMLIDDLHSDDLLSDINSFISNELDEYEEYFANIEEIFNIEVLHEQLQNIENMNDVLLRFNESVPNKLRKFIAQYFNNNPRGIRFDTIGISRHFGVPMIQSSEESPEIEGLLIQFKSF